jgi:adenylate cyclase
MQSDFEQLTTINKKIQLLYFLLDVIREFSAETNDDRRMALVIDKAAQLVNADRSAVFLLDAATKEICAKVPDPQQTIRETRFPRDLGLIGYAASTGRTVNVPETSSDPHFRAEIDEKPVYQAQSILVTPLRDNGGQIFGVLEVLNKQDGRFTPDDEYLLQAFAAQASLALKSPPPGIGAPPLVSNPILLIMKALSGGLGIDNLLQSLMKKTTQVMNADRSTLFLIDFEKQEIWSKIAEGTRLK